MPTSYSRIKELAARIQAQTTELDEQLSSYGLPSPTFETSAVDELPPALHGVQNSLLEAADELILLVRGPLYTLMDLASYSRNSHTSLHAIVHFNIATAFPVEATATFAAIATACNLSLSDTTRILRHAMTYHIFRESSPGRVSHTASSSLLAFNPLLRAYIACSINEVTPSADLLVKAMERWPQSQEPNEAAWNLAHGEEKPMFVAMSADQNRAESFAQAMTWFQAKPGLAGKHLTAEKSLDWERVRKVVDIGGSHGTIGKDLVERYPGLEVVVQDLPQVIESTQKSGELIGRLTFMTHDFFKDQPVKDADVYLLRWILHDWSDHYAVKILRAVVPALRPGSRLIINEMCLPEPGTASPYEQRFLRSQDLVMKQIQNAKERDSGDWEALLRLADPRLKILDIKKPHESELAIISVALEC